MLKMLKPSSAEQLHQRLYAQIGWFLSEHRLDPSPDNYALAHQLVADRESPVAREIRRVTSDGVRLSQADADRIRRDFGMQSPPGSASDEVEEEGLAQARILIERFAMTLEQARADTEGYSRDLQAGATALETDGRTFTLMDLIRLTRSILERTRAAERRLAETDREALELRERLSRVEEEARLDPLTRIPNRRAFQGRCRELEEQNVPMAFAICDLDHFKPINDEHGHGVGDRVLKMVAKHLEEACAPHLVARLGGEEFVALFERLSAAEAAEVVDSARRALVRKDFTVRETGIPIGKISFSAGIAMSDAGSGMGLKRADELLYEAKNSGRNQVRFDGENRTETSDGGEIDEA